MGMLNAGEAARWGNSGPNDGISAQGCDTAARLVRWASSHDIYYYSLRHSDPSGSAQGLTFYNAVSAVIDGHSNFRVRGTI